MPDPAATIAAAAPAVRLSMRRPRSYETTTAASAKTTQSQRKASAEESKRNATWASRKGSGAPPRSHTVVWITSPSGRALIRPETASSSKSGFDPTSGTSSTRRYAAAPTTAAQAARTGRLALDRSTRAVHLARKVSSQDAFEPLRHADQPVEVDPGLDSLAMQEVDEVLGGDVPRRAGREGAAAEPSDRGLEDSRAGLQGGVGVGEPGIPRVVEVDPDGQAEVLRPRDEVAGLTRHADSDRVREHDLARSRGHAPLGESEDRVRVNAPF